MAKLPLQNPDKAREPMPLKDFNLGRFFSNCCCMSQYLKSLSVKISSLFLIFLLAEVNLAVSGAEKGKADDKPLSRTVSSKDAGLVYLARAVELNALSREKEALPWLNMAIKANPQDADSYLERARCIYSLGDFKGALRDLDLAIKLNPANMRIYSRRGYVMLVLGRRDEGIKDLTRAIAANYVDPVDQTPSVDYQNRAKAYKAVGKFKEAEADFKEARELEDLQNARLLRQQLELNEARKLVEGVLSRRPEVNFAHFLGGVIYLNCGMFKQAYEQFSLVIKAFPKEPASYYFRAEASTGLKDYKKAIADYDVILALRPRFAALNYTAETGRFKEGSKNMDVSPVVMSDIRFLKARALDLDKQTTLALNEFKACYAANPQDEQILYAMADIFLQKKDYDQAIKLCKEALKVTPKKFEGYGFLAQIYKQQGKLPEAIKSTTSLIKSDEGDTNAYYLRAQLYSEMRDYAKAAMDYTKIIAISKSECEAWRGRAEVNLLMAKKAEALSDFRQAAKIDPTYRDSLFEFEQRLSGVSSTGGSHH